MGLSVAPVVVGDGIIRFQLYRLVIVRNGLVVAAEMGFSVAPVVVGGGIIRFQLYRLVICVYRGFPIRGITFVRKIADRKPGMVLKIAIASLQDMGNGAPFFERCFHVSVIL